ncbi:hypothetical protein GDO78_005660, partial [Eleutherodactylus coqui]
MADMTGLCCLLPLLWALGWGQAITTTQPIIVGTSPTVSIPPPTVASTSVIQSNSAVPTTAATTSPTVKPVTPTVIPSGPAATTKLTTAISSGSGGVIHSTTVGVPSTTTKAITPNVTSTHPPNATSAHDKSTQPTNFTKAPTTVSKDNTGIVTSQPIITENATKLAATLPPISKTSEQSKEIAKNHSSTVAWLSTVPPSPVTEAKSTAGSILDSTTSLLKENPPDTTISVNYDQENIQVNCKAEHGESLVKIKIKPSRICGADANDKDTKEILKHICTALKPGYQPNKDKCHIDLSSEIPGQMVIVHAYVQSSLSPGELYASLKHIKKDGTDLFEYDPKKYEEEDVVSIPLISAIVSLAVALLIAAAIYGCWHQRQTRKREQ